MTGLRTLQPFPDRFHADFLCGCQSVMGKEIESCEYAPGYCHSANLWISGSLIRCCIGKTVNI